MERIRRPPNYFLARYHPNDTEITFLFAPINPTQAYFLWRIWNQQGSNVFILPEMRLAV